MARTVQGGAGVPGCRGGVQGAGGVVGGSRVKGSAAHPLPLCVALTVGMAQGAMRETQDNSAEPKAMQQRTVVALKGQLLHWRLLVANAGQCTCNFHIGAR